MKTYGFAFLVPLILFGCTAHSAIQTFTLAGASTDFNAEINDSIVWGVFAGLQQIDGSNTAPYNSCALADIDATEEANGGLETNARACHKKRVDGNTIIEVTFIEDAEAGQNLRGAAVQTFVGGSVETSGSRIQLDQTQPLYTTNTTVKVELGWDTICEALGRTASPNITTTVNNNGICVNDATSQPANGDVTVEFGLLSGTDTITFVSTGQTITFRVYNPTGLDTIGLTDGDDEGTDASPCEAQPDATGNNQQVTGYCNANIFPGDGGGFVFTDSTQLNTIQYLDSSVSYTTVTNSNQSSSYTGLQVYFTPVTTGLSYETILPTNPNIIERDFSLSSPGAAANDFANEEFSGLQNNVTYAYRVASIDESGTISQFFDSTYCADVTTCNYTLTPSEVAGVIRENSCFITTATYGSASAYQVKTFRLFRKNFLWTNWVGVKIIKFYNTHGPKAARWLNENPALKPLFRLFLYPAYVFASLSLKLGLFATVLISVLSLVLFLQLLKKRLRSVKVNHV